MGEHDVPLGDLISGLPNNWNRWGPDDEIGSLNFLDGGEVLRGLRSAKQGKVFTLSLVISGTAQGDPVLPGRIGAMRLMARDKSHYLSGKVQPYPGGVEVADDFLLMHPQGTTHFDALGHAWLNDKLWNAFPASTTMGGLERDSILPISEHGVAGSAVLLDMARFFGKEFLSSEDSFDLNDLLACAKKQDIEIQKHDILLVRTGWFKIFYEKGAKEFYGDGFLHNPGLRFSEELVNWFYRTEIPVLGTDTIANERRRDPETGVVIPLHIGLMNRLGVIFNEMLWLEALADDCAKDHQYRFLFVASPLKVSRGAGAPANPIAIK